MTDDLVVFLKARLDEDETVARAALDATTSYDVEDSAVEEFARLAVNEGAREEVSEHLVRHDPKLVLADIASKRQLIEAGDDLVREHENTICNDEFAAGRFCGRARSYQSELLRLLALPYAGHPHHREEWRP